MRFLFPLLAVALFGHAGLADAGPLDDLFAGEKDVCYERTYSDEHLASHPKQTVDFIRFAHLPSLTPAGERQPAGADFTPLADVEASFRDTPKLFGNAVVCFRGKDGQYCGVECDGGQFRYWFNDKGSLLIEFDRNGSVALESSCGEGEESSMRFLGDASDDKVFRLDPVDPAQCKATIEARRERWRAGQ